MHCDVLHEVQGILSKIDGPKLYSWSNSRSQSEKDALCVIETEGLLNILHSSNQIKSRISEFTFTHSASSLWNMF